MYLKEIREMPVSVFKDLWIKVNTNRFPWPGHQFVHDSEWPDLQTRVANFVEEVGKAHVNNS